VIIIVDAPWHTNLDPTMSTHVLPSQFHMQVTDTTTRLLLERTQSTIDHLSETLAKFITEEESALSQVRWHRQQLEVLERKCEDLRVHIERTQSAKLNMESIVQDLSYSLSPMKTTPTEILIRIFEISVDEEVKSVRSSLSKGLPVTPTPIPLILSQVCKRWRAIMAGTPSLWNFLYFDATDGDPPQGIDLFQRYAGFGSPDQQSVVIPECDIADLGFFCTTIGVPEVPYKSLELVMIEDPVSESQTGWNIELLSSREVTIYRSDDVETLEFVVPLLQVAHSITIYGAPPDWDAPPWTILETLILRDFCNAEIEPDEPSIYSFTRDDFIALLDATPSLKRLVLDFYVDEGDMEWDDHIAMSCSTIKHLSTHLHHFTGSKGLFGVQLALPALETLEILSLRCASPIPEEEEFICKNLTPKRVVLHQMNDADVTLAGQLLRQLPNANSLEMTGRHCNNLLRLAHADYHSISPPSMPLPIPQVTALHITDTDVQGDTLIRFLEIKLQHRKAGTLGVVCIEDIMMYTTPEVTPAEQDR
jgi:hypothetical protein